MTWVIIIMFLTAAAFIAIGLYLQYRIKQRETTAAKDVNEVIIGRTLQKNANKQKILEYINNKGRANNAELRKLIGVTDRTVVRYMDELEREGKIRQIGGTGRGVFYHRQ